MKPLPAQETTKKLNLLEQYIAEHGLPPRVELHPDDIPRLTEEEQRATIEICQAIAAGDEEAGKRLNVLWEEIWDRLAAPEIETALAEAEEKGTIPWETVKKELGLE
ncbi:MAG: hypothetical protein ABIH23_05705 [bacterium]